jgi:transposase InsO family protein
MPRSSCAAEVVHTWTYNDHIITQLRWCGDRPRHHATIGKVRIRQRRPYKARVTAEQELFDQIEIFYNLPRTHAGDRKLPPAQFELKAALKVEGV